MIRGATQRHPPSSLSRTLAHRRPLSTASPLPPNSAPSFRFPEEPLASSPAGFYPALPHERLKSARYEVLRKLGYGGAASVWLVKDHHPSPGSCTTLHALKVLNANNTRGVLKRCVHELPALLRLKPKYRSPDPRSSTVPLLSDDFFVSSRQGEHLCLVMGLSAQSVKEVAGEARGRKVPEGVVRRVVREVLKALSYVHERRVIHADVKSDNILLCPFSSLSALHPPRTSPALYDPPTATVDGVEYTLFKSQPLREQVRWDDPPEKVEGWNWILSDFGSAQLVDSKRKAWPVQPYALRAPEVVLKAPYSTPIDVWSVGCLAFELLTGRWLFYPTADPQGRYAAEEDHLAKMLACTGQRFPPALSASSAKASEYLTRGGDLLHHPGYPSTSIRSLLAASDVLSSERSLDLASDFILQCLTLNPWQRPSAKELCEGHEWLKAAVTP